MCVIQVSDCLSVFVLYVWLYCPDACANCSAVRMHSLQQQPCRKPFGTRKRTQLFCRMSVHIQSARQMALKCLKTSCGDPEGSCVMVRHVPSYIQEKKLLQRLGVAQSSVVDMQFGYDMRAALRALMWLSWGRGFFSSVSRVLLCGACLTFCFIFLDCCTFCVRDQFKTPI